MFTTRRRRDLQRIQQLEYEIKRLSDAQQMMLDANDAVEKCDRSTLSSMGFEAEHVEELLQRGREGKHAFPAYAIGNNQDAVEHLEQLLAAERSRPP
jgi:hypothetical protein